MRVIEFAKLLRQTARAWFDGESPRRAAALAFYSMLSLGPLLIIVLAVASAVSGKAAAEGKLIEQIQGFVGQDGARVIQDIIADSVQKKNAGLIASITGLATLLFGASGVFTELQAAMNDIWRVQAKKTFNWRQFLRRRLFSVSMVLCVGFLLLFSLFISAALSAFSHFTQGYLSDVTALMQGVNFVASFTVVTFLFYLIFKYVPDVFIAGRDVFVGAVLTAFLFTLGKTAIGFYLGSSSFTSSYGAAGSLAVVLIWVYYSAQILFFGARFTQVYAHHRGQKTCPTEGAVHAPSDRQKSSKNSSRSRN